MTTNKTTATATNEIITRKEVKTMEKTNEIATCEKFMPAINNAVNHYGIDMEKTAEMLKNENAMAGAMYLQLDSNIKAIVAKKARNEKVLNDENTTELKKKVASAEITQCDNDLATLQPLFGGIDILKSTDLITIENEVAVYMYGVKKCSYLYHEDLETILAFVEDLNNYGLKHYENACKLVEGKQISDKKFYQKICDDIQTICIMLCPNADFKVKSKHVKRVLDKLVSVKTSADKNNKGKTDYSYAKPATIIQEICAMIAEKLENFNTELQAFVKPEKK